MLKGVAALTWDASDAATAAAWAAGCQFAHNPNRGNRGENIYASTSAAARVANAAASWNSEEADWNCQVCGVWVCGCDV